MNNIGINLLDEKEILTVPENFVSDTFINDFYKNELFSSSTDFISPDLTDVNFKLVSKKLLPNERYHIRMYPVEKDNVLDRECFDFLFNKKTTFVGAQGLILLKQLKPHLFTENKRVLSFDKTRKLPVIDHERRYIPGISYGYRKWSYFMAPLHSGRGTYNLLLSFQKIE